MVFLCVISAGSVAVSLGYQPANAVQSGHERITPPEATHFAADPLAGPLSSRPEECGGTAPARETRPASPNLQMEVIASWYGSYHHNRLTASGQRFDMYQNTLAHRTLPLGTRVRFVNPDNGKSAEGIITDRGPYIDGRQVDLSYAMAEQLDFVERGVVKLDMELLPPAGE